MSALGVLQHALGLDEYGQGRSYRRHYVAGEGHSDFATCVELVAQGLMIRRTSRIISCGELFHVTEAGERWAREHSPFPPKRSAGQARYQRYLDEDSNVSFGEWLKVGRGRIARPVAWHGYDPDLNDVVPF